jgi:hypothetical protein
MIRRQYDHYHRGYFKNFIDSMQTTWQPELREEVRAALKPYQATVAKSKAPYRYNIKFYNAKLYSLFVMRWA